MAKSLESPTKLTEFAPLNPEVQQTGIRSKLSRWFGKNKPNPTIKDIPESQPPSRSPSRDDVSQTGEPTCLIPNIYAEGRTLVSVLTRVSNLLAQKGTYNEADFKQYWMPDSVSKECYECGEKFTAIRRKHHCRICGQIFCSHCCHQQVPGKLMGYSGNLRACVYCCQIVLSCLQSIDPSSDLSTDLKRIQEDLQKKLSLLQPVLPSSSAETRSNNDSASRNSTLKRKVSLSFQEERFAPGSSTTQTQLTSAERKVLLHDSTQLKALHEELIHPVCGISLQNHRYKLRSLPNCCIGSEVVDWLLAQDKAASRMQAVAIGQALVDANFLDCLSSSEQIFVDGYSLYRPKMVEKSCVDNTSTTEGFASFHNVEDSQEPLWVRQIGMQEDDIHSRTQAVDSFTTDILDCRRSVDSQRDVVDSLQSAKSLSTRHKKGDELLHSSELSSLPAPNSPSYPQTDFSPQTQESKVLNNLFEEHNNRLLKQLLSSEGLSLSWADILMPLVNNVAYTVRPDVKNDDDDMDIRQYVHLKKVPGGLKTDSRVINGVICSKNVANRNMAQWIHDPNILLLSSAIDYQRVGSKLISLEPLMMQENEYLKNAVAKIAAFKPEILLVEKVVSGLAQEFLLNLGVTLILNVKPSVMDRVSRNCQADIVPSIDAHVTKPRLGSCRLFHLETIQLDAHRSKTLMFFDGCQPRLGCTILLRGGSPSELKKIKKIARFMIYVAYNARLERAFLTDEFAVPRVLGCMSEIFNESANNNSELPSTSNNLDDESMVIVDKGVVFTDDLSDPMTHKINISDQSSKELDVGRHFKIVSDLDDPLHEYLRSGQSDLSLGSTPVDSKTLPLRLHTCSVSSRTMLFRKALEDTILSVSPLLRHGLPYLETEAGRNAFLSKYLPLNPYNSPQLKQESPPRKLKHDVDFETKEVMRKISMNDCVQTENGHPFLRAKIIPSMSKKELLTLLADFRARGVPRKMTDIRNNKALLNTTENADKRNASDFEDDRSQDCLDPFNHQRLCVLFSSYCLSASNTPYYCVSPWVIDMDFYGRNDITLGGFLEKYCFHTNYACPSATCQSSVTAHIRRFVHDQSCILVIIRQLANPVNGNASGLNDRSILMWSWCKKCKQVSPISTMSNQTWHFSFAKYLELRFHGNVYCRRLVQPNEAGALVCACPHPLHTEHFHYFGCRDLVASFKYTSISLREIVLAPTVINISLEGSLVPKLIEEIRTVAQFGHGLYASISDWLSAFLAECAGTKLELSISSMIEQQIQERTHFRKRIEEIQLMLTSPNLQASPSHQLDIEEHLWHILDHEVLLKRIIVETVAAWNPRLQDIAIAKKKEDKVSTSKSTRSLVSHSSIASLDVEKPLNEPEKQPSAILDLKSKRVSECAINVNDSPVFTLSPNTSRDEPDKIVSDTRKNTSDTSRSSSLSSSPSNKSPFLRYRSSSDFMNSTPLAGDQSIKMDESIDPVNKGHHRTSSQASSEADSADGRYDSKPPTQATNNRLSLGTLLSMVGSSPLLTSPYHQTEHHLLPPGASVPLVVYEDEPSSIIAYALASVDYEHQLAELKANLAEQMSSSTPYSASQTASDRWYDNIEREDPSGRGSGSISYSASSAAPPAGLYLSNQHLEIQFSDSSTKFYCRVYYAEPFRVLRSQVFPPGEERFIRSLSRCVPWAALGGKSGSTFCKTQDDRFVLKQMSKMEIQSFIDLAPNYIAYVQQALRDKRPTALCKIIGAYRIVFKNSQTNAASKQDLLVMENLFYNTNVNMKFDLKGSERNRLVSTSEVGLSDCVLLDENLLKMIWENPLYVREFSRSVLNSALSRDTQFLASQLVMDYSLLVGIDDETNQLIVGIIDYIRTFTWDKRLETFVKSSGILGGQGKMPTVVSPELYRTRFCEAMNRYFLGVPDRWTGLGSNSL